MTTLSSETQWYAVHAKTHHEGLAAANVATNGIEVFFPRVKRQRLVHGIARAFIKPLFAGYFFARFCPAVDLDVVRYARGVLNVVSTGRFPIPLGDEIVASIQAQVQSDGCVEILPPAMEPGNWVAIEHGPFQGLMGQIAQEGDDRRRVTILLETMSWARVSVEKRWLSLASAA
jgi:transcriptional antiterminator RfaH